MIFLRYNFRNCTKFPTMPPLPNETKSVLCKRGPFFLTLASTWPWPCVETKWIVVTVSLLQSSSGDHTLSVKNGGGDCLYLWPLPNITLKKCGYKYRGTCCSRKEKIVLKIMKDKEKIILWAGEEDLDGWLEMITSCQVAPGQPPTTEKNER